MILGNSNGKNRGKKYIMRDRADYVPAKGGAAKAEAFSQWFNETYHSLVAELHAKDMFDDEVLNETYLRMYDYILYSGSKIENYRSYFIRSFFTNLIQGKVKENRYRSIDDTYDEVDAAYDFDLEVRQQQLEQDIFTYVYGKYKIREFELFKMYVSLKPAVNYEVLSKITHLKVHHIQGVVSKIKSDICRNSDFVRRRQEARS